MAPELLRHEPAAAAMDLFSLGLVMYELATGTAPYDTPADTEESATADDPAGDPRARAGGPGRGREPQLLGRPAARPGALVADLPRGLDAVIWRLLDPTPAGRPATARAALSELAAALPADLAAADRPWPAWAAGLLTG
jgi:hypothetical protein